MVSESVTSEGDNIVQRVVSPEATITNDPTSAKALWEKPHTHEQRTQQNTPGKLLNIVPTKNPSTRTSPRLNSQNVRKNKTVSSPVEMGIPSNTTSTTSKQETSPINSLSFNKETSNPAWEPNGTQIPICSPNNISQEAINFIYSQCYNDPGETWVSDVLITFIPDTGPSGADINIEHYCAPVMHPVTGETITQYKKLKNDPLLKDIWETGLGKEFG